MLPSYRNQSIDLQSKYFEWFLIVSVKSGVGESIKQVVPIKLYDSKNDDDNVIIHHKLYLEVLGNSMIDWMGPQNLKRKAQFLVVGQDTGTMRHQRKHQKKGEGNQSGWKLEVKKSYNSLLVHFAVVSSQRQKTEGVSVRCLNWIWLSTLTYTLSI